MAGLKTLRRNILLNSPHIENASGSFSTDMAAPLKSLSVELSPIQDLHGYDRPWGPGAGKNLATFVHGYNINTSGQIIEYYSQNRMCMLTPVQIVPGTSYVLSSKADDTWWMYAVLNGESLVRRVANQKGPVVVDTTGGTHFYICFYSLVREPKDQYDYRMVTEEEDEPQLEIGTVPTSYEPYQNICQIGGHDSASVTVGGTAYSADFAESVYGGSMDFVSGRLNSSMARLEVTNTSLIEDATASGIFKCRIPYSAGSEPPSDGTAGSSNQVSNGVGNYQGTVGNIGGSEVSMFKVASDGYIYFYAANHKDLASTRAFAQKLIDNSTPLTFVWQKAASALVTLAPKRIETVRGQNAVSSDLGAVRAGFWTH